MMLLPRSIKCGRDDATPPYRIYPTDSYLSPPLDHISLPHPPPHPPSTSSSTAFCVVVTGSTKGVGLELAKAFLAAGDRVLISSRRADQVERTVLELRALGYASTQVAGCAANVSDPEDIDRLASTAVTTFGRIDCWINNAGSNAYQFTDLIESDASAVQEIVSTNLLGTILGIRAAIRVMRTQKSGGHVFSMDGAGAGGNATPRFAAYGATKRALAQLNKSIRAELAAAKVNHVGVHDISPGMVVTNLLMCGADTAAGKVFINALAEPASDVAAFLVPRIRSVLAANADEPSTVSSEVMDLLPPLERLRVSVRGILAESGMGVGAGNRAVVNGTYIQFLTLPIAFSKILRRAFLGEGKDRWIKE